ncbi:helix-turn-helix domain-containing protein, partial [Streptomyces cacaoi]
MPRWKALPDELDPQIKEFTSQLRRLVDRSGMSIATVADRTGYSKSSWERYLNGRLLPPRGATQALAEVTGTEVRHLGTMWELAERAWSRSEMRHDVTMEAIQVAQARAALGVDEDESAKGRKRRRGKGAAPSTATP